MEWEAETWRDFRKDFSVEELRTLRREFPELWSRLLEWETKTWRNFRKDFSVQELDFRFRFEEERIREGKRIRGKEFFKELYGRLGRDGDRAEI